VTEEPADLLYFSYPFAGNGQFEKIPEGNKAVFLDCAYLFASNMTNARQLPDNVEYLAFSVSKSHNLADIRCGWVMTRKKIEAYHLMQYTYGYGSSAHVSVLQSVLSQVPNYLYLKYKDTFSAMYNANALREGDTNLFATKRSGERVPWYKLISNE
jgi:histidinol-phosphate/aromatic aminotransferase/cobyric acid decarboxylase-like protein